ncbi:MAG: SDR family NAD(P)-dependent oxidoreductase [Gemmatimonadota bacterium]|nr:SDR family NAD(P)-dependent oxidoreductase [Gemmatimonadota bacterium]
MIRRPRSLIAALLAIPLVSAACGSAPPDARADETVIPDQTGEARERVILVTGSTGGLGREVARRLASGGAHVIVHGRDRERGLDLVREIEEGGVGSARFYAADFGSLANVRRLAEAVRRDYDRLDVLVNNAGILMSPNRRPVSDDGYELHFQVNYLAGFLLTRLLLPLLEESAPARIVNVSSRSSAALDFDNLMLERGYSTSRAYGQSKLAQVMFTLDLAERLEGTGVTVNALHPATLMPTDLVLEYGMRPRDSIEDGVEAVLNLIDTPEAGSGHYYNGLERARSHAQAYDPAVRARLREVSEELTGLSG